MPKDFQGRIPMPSLDPNAGEKINLKLKIVNYRNGERVRTTDRQPKPQLKLDEAFQGFLPSLKPKTKAKGLICTSRTPSPCLHDVQYPHLQGMPNLGKGMDDASSFASYNLRLRQGSVRGNPKQPLNLPPVSDATNASGSSSFKAKKERLKSSKHRGGMAKEKRAKQSGVTKLPDIAKGQRPTAPRMDAWAPVTQNQELAKLGMDNAHLATAVDDIKTSNVVELPAVKGANTILSPSLMPLVPSEEDIPIMLSRKIRHQEHHSGKRFHARSPGDQMMWARKRFNDNSK